MAGTNDFLPFADAGGANVISQATYAAAAYLAGGRGSGILPSNVYNKIARQSSVSAYLCGQIICDILGVNAQDDGDLTTLLANFKSAITGLAFTTGDVKLTYKTVADTGWIMIVDGTIGSATSGATYANADAQALYTLIWNNVSNTWAAVSGGRGASAALDFAANKSMALPKLLGRALAVAGAGSGLTSRALGQTLGEELHTMTLAELVAHNHTLFVTILAASGANFQSMNLGSAGGNVTGTTGSSTPFNVMQPSGFINMMVHK